MFEGGGKVSCKIVYKRIGKELILVIIYYKNVKLKGILFLK